MADPSMTAAQAAPEGQEQRPGRRRALKVLAAAVIVILLAAAAVLGSLFYKGALAPGDAAAKYGTFEYVTETEVTEYITTYKEQMGYGDATDEEWATFLAAYNMTPERLRASTIDQLVTDKLVEKKCRELGLGVEDSELQDALSYYKGLYASGSDEIWEETLGAYGQTDEGFMEMIELNILKEKLCESQVETPEPTDEQVREVIATYIDTAVSNERPLTLKHSYCFKKAKSSSEGSLEEREEVQKIRDGLVDVGTSQESFASIIDLYCDDDELRNTGGANGWDADATVYSDEYVKALGTVGEGGVSSVFADDDCYFFIWVSATYTLPKKSSKAAELDLSAMPESLLQYFEDTAAYTLWSADSQEYLASLSSQVSVIYYDMPADVPYNVDMSLASVPEEDTTTAEPQAAEGEE
ncbi:MAG: SurA N-terminal domain-containing protein [Coriobacteriales bacterium]